MSAHGKTGPAELISERPRLGRLLPRVVVVPRLVLSLSFLLLLSPFARAARPDAGVPQLVFPPIDAERLLAEDAARTDGGPLRFAEPILVAITPATDGAWKNDQDGGRTWRLRIHVPAATDLNLGFTRFDLPDGASLSVVGEEEDRLVGPFARSSATEGQLWTPVVVGDRALVTLHVPAGAPDPEIVLGQIGAGYRHFGRDPWHLDSPCSLDVACPEGDPWRDEIDSVAMYSLDGTWQCSGTLVMDVPRTWTPYFLTAAHCDVRDAVDAATVVTYFNYQVAECAGPRGAPLDQSIVGSLFRARRADVDVCLLELSSCPPAAYHPYWAGWDRTDFPPQATVHIHHPNIDEKEIAFNDDPLTTSDSCLVGGAGIDSHWHVDDYERGITERGSSGSGIWDASNHRVVGWLSAGTATCSVPDGYDCYGRFAIGWNGASAATRLRDWLDPGGNSPPGVDGGRPGIVLAPPVTFADSCPGGPGDGDGEAEPGETIELLAFLTTEACAEYTSVTGYVSSSSPWVTMIDSAATWPDLVGGGTFLSNAPHPTARIDEGAPCGTQLDFELTAWATEGGPFVIPFSIDMPAPATCDICAAPCVVNEIAEAPPDVLRVRKGAPGIVVLSYPQTTWCGGAIQVRMAHEVEPATRPGSWPTDPDFADVTSLDMDPGIDFAIDPPDDNRYFLVVETKADGTPGPSGSY